MFGSTLPRTFDVRSVFSLSIVIFIYFSRLQYLVLMNLFTVLLFAFVLICSTTAVISISI
ncbi:hypothetical protein BDR07DRAFT_628945 [Suillus spraguei]|nr:hypothetical protein BDR07DRAFT_628945 [Suillus spraguei]